MSTEATAEIGVTGLSVMGRNLARNLARHGYTRRAAQPQRRAHPQPGRRSRRRGRVRAERVDGGVRRVAAAAARGHHHGEGGRRDRRGDRRAGAAARPGRHHHRLRQRAFHRHRCGARRRWPSRGCTSSAPASPAARRARSTARASCPAAPTRRTQKLGPIFETHRRAGRRHPVRHARRSGRRRSLRQDGAQRHRVRRHAADRRGVRPAALRAWTRARPRSPRSSASWNAASWSRS